MQGRQYFVNIAAVVIRWWWQACYAELAATMPAAAPRRVVVSASDDSWQRDPPPPPHNWWHPLTPPEMDRLWQGFQRDRARRLSAPRIVADTAGHFVHRDEPDLVAHVVGQVLAAARTGRCDATDDEPVRLRLGDLSAGLEVALMLVDGAAVGSWRWPISATPAVTPACGCAKPRPPHGFGARDLPARAEQHQRRLRPYRPARPTPPVTTAPDRRPWRLELTPGSAGRSVNPERNPGAGVRNLPFDAAGMITLVLERERRVDILLVTWAVIIFC